MSTAEAKQTGYEIPPRDGFSVARFFTVSETERSVDFYETVFGGSGLSAGDSNGAPGYVKIANTSQHRPTDVLPESSHQQSVERLTLTRTEAGVIRPTPASDFRRS